MTMSDPVADMLTRIRNALKARSEVVEIPFSTLKFDLAKTLKEEGYISGCDVIGEGVKKVLQLGLRYSSKKESIIIGLERESKPSRRVYLGYRDIQPVMKGFGVAILSTPKGVLTDKKARELKVGGEVICKVW